jgi:catechol 2,3-dioxygenase-like lactoylglutathione lyase family enzyme
MLADYPPVANVTTTNLARARAFYEGVLGFRPVSEVEAAGVVVYEGASGRLVLYVSQFAGTNKSTAVGFELPLDTFDAELAALRAAGVTFDTFDVPGIVWDGDVAVSGGGKAAWFQDPDGNIIGLTAGEMG